MSETIQKKLQSTAQIIMQKAMNGKIDKVDAAEIIEKLLKIDDKTQKEEDDIAVIGVSLKMPKSEDADEFWKNIRDGVDCVSEYPENRKKDSKDFVLTYSNIKSGDIQYRMGGYLDEIDKFDYNFFKLSPNEAALMDPHQRLFLETAWQAIEDAGYGNMKLKGSKTGVYVGYTGWPMYGHYITMTDPEQANISVSGNVSSITASRISYVLDFKGPSILIDTACSSSLVALHLACQGIKNGECEQALAGGVKVSIAPADGVFSIGIESTANKTMAFDDRSDGTVWGEGVGAVLLKPLERAIKDGDPIYAVIKGSAINQDGTSVGITAPNLLAQEEVIVDALKSAEVDAETITYIEAHGTGTKLGDPIEISGIDKAYRHFTNKKQFCSVGSLKTNIGHLDCASGIASFIKAVLALKNRELPPSIHFNYPNRKINFEQTPVFINDKLSKWEANGSPRRCGVSSFGFSGTNCHVILEEAPESKKEMENAEKRVHLLTISAKTQTAFERILEKYRKFAREDTCSGIADICYTANTGRGHYAFRMALVLNNREELSTKLEAIDIKNLKSIEGMSIFYGYHKVIQGEPGNREKGQISNQELSACCTAAMEKVSEFISAGMEDESYLKEVCNLYIKGADIKWNELYKDEVRSKVRLPVYQFDRERCWLEQKNNEQKDSLCLKGRENGVYSDCEILVSNAWANVLGLKSIGIDDDFFELGGNSLLAIKLEVELEKNNYKFQTADIFKYRTIKELAAFLSGENSIIPIKVKGEINISDSCSSKNENHSQEIVLQGIEPFNEIFYKNCFYNSAFPIIKHYGRSIIPLLSNDILVYINKSGKEKAALGVEYHSGRPVEELLIDSGLSFKTKTNYDDIVNALICSISLGRPVIIWVDCFYESIRADMYMKTHWDHTLLVYGYNLTNKTFNIIEHKHKDNLSYEKMTIGFDDMVHSSKGYFDNFANQSETALSYEFACNGGIDYSEIDKNGDHSNKTVYVENIKNNKSIILQSFDHLNRFIEAFSVISQDNTLLEIYAEELLNNLNEIINAKRVEKYKIENLFALESETLGIINEIIDRWTFMRGVIAKYVYSNIYKKEALLTCVEKLQNISKLEEELYISIER